MHLAPQYFVLQCSKMEDIVGPEKPEEGVCFGALILIFLLKKKITFLRAEGEGTL